MAWRCIRIAGEQAKYKIDRGQLHKLPTLTVVGGDLIRLVLRSRKTGRIQGFRPDLCLDCATLRSRGRRLPRLKGNNTALTGPELEGYRLFKSVGCVSCHQGVGIGGNLFEKVGVVKPDLPNSGITLRVPSLRNITTTSPYFHDGSAPTLMVAVRHMASEQLGLALDDKDIDLIVAFLRTLDGRYDGHSVTASR